MGLSRRTWIKRGKRIRPVSPDKQRKRENVGAFGPLCDIARGRDCVLVMEECGPSITSSDPAHVGARGIGGGRGDWVREAFRNDNDNPWGTLDTEAGRQLPGYGQLVLLEDGVWRWAASLLQWVPVRGAVCSLCRKHHTEFDHEMGGNPARFLEKYDANLINICREIGINYVRSLNA